VIAMTYLSNKGFAFVAMLLAALTVALVVILNLILPVGAI
jgi:hypothetical protein